MRQEQATNAWTGNPTERGKRANEAHSAPSLSRSNDSRGYCYTLRRNQRAEASLDHTTQ
jgi:hypothetical protein